MHSVLARVPVSTRACMNMHGEVRRQAILLLRYQPPSFWGIVFIGVTGGYELIDVGAWHLTWLLWKKGKLLTSELSPQTHLPTL